MTDTLHIYTRISSDGQEDNTSLENQLSMGKRLAERLGLKFKLWNEGIQSSSREDLLNRPVIMSLMEEVREGTAKHIFVEYQDRLSRSDQTSAIIRKQFRDNGVLLYFADSNTPKELTSPLDNLMFGIQSEISQYENAVRTNRLYNGKFNRVREGKWQGGQPPFGYDLEDGFLVVNQEEAKWAIKSIEIYANGGTLRDIRDMLLENAVLTKRGKGIWSLGSIDAMLKNTHYEGYYKVEKKKFGREEFVNTCPPIISPKLADKYKEMRESRSNQSKIKNPNEKQEHLLKNLIFCGVCENGFNPQKSNRGYFYYGCKSRQEYWRTKNPKFLCDNPIRSVKKEIAEPSIWEGVIDVLSQSVIFKEKVKQAELSKQSFESKLKDEKKIRGKHKRLQQDIDKITKAIGTQKANQLLLDEEDIDTSAIIESLVQKRERLRQEQGELDTTLSELTSLNKWVDWIAKFDGEVDRLKGLKDFKEKQEFLTGVVDRIEVHGEDKKNIKLKVTLKQQYVSDSLIWQDESNKSLGYQIQDGEGEFSVDLGLKKSD